LILLDTSVLVDALTGSRNSRLALRAAVEAGERCVLPALVLYEWLRGPRSPEEIGVQEALFPSELAVPFGAAEATISAGLYRSLHRPRERAIDLAIAAHAIHQNIPLWTLNRADFIDIPRLELYNPR
jgi:predicted nucleic acid-binding protein